MLRPSLHPQKFVLRPSPLQVVRQIEDLQVVGATNPYGNKIKESKAPEQRRLRRRNAGHAPLSLNARLYGPVLNLKAPDHTTLSRRNQIVAVPPLTRSHDGPIDLIVDSTGLKILGCGEWNAHKHKASKKRRDWRKLHIGVDAEGFIVAAELTASSRDDASTLPALLDTIEVPIRRFTADGAYDHRSVYDQLSAAGTENVVIVIPPRRSAVSAGPTDGPWAQRDTALERIRQVGRREWQKESGYRQQARVENSFFRYKSVLGGGLKARHGKAQRREVAIGCHILNRMAELGRPKFCAVVS